MPPLNSRLFIGAEMGTLLAPKVWIEGKRAEGGDSGLHAGAQAGYVQDLGTSNVRLLTMGRFSSWDSEWASTRHESRFRIDLSVGPEFRVESKPARPRLGWHFSAPVGLTIGSPGRQSGRAVSEVHAVGYGINLGLNAGIDISGRHHGGYVDLGYLAHVMWMKHTSTLTARPSTTLVEQYRLADHVLMLTFGYLYWL